MADPKQVDQKQLELEESMRCFTLARSQGVRINLVFLLDKCEVSRFAAPCIMIKNGHFVIRAEMEQLATHPIIWGAEVSGYFVVMNDGKPLPCHFQTKLVRIYNGPLNSVYLVFPVPEMVDHNQRRFSKRVNIDREKASGFGIWHGRFVNGDQDSLPELAWTPFENEECELGEMSASGMRLDIREANPLSQYFINDPILLKGCFGKTDANSLFVRACIVRAMSKPETEGVISYGCRFLAWRKIITTSPNTWFRVDEDGVGAIAEWLNRNFRSVSS